MNEVFETPPRVLIVAPNASSTFGGEAFLPLKYFEILRRRGNAPHLLTHVRNKADLERYFGTLEGIDFIPDSRAHRLIWRIRSFLPAIFDELLFGPVMSVLDHALIAPRIRRLVSAGEVDLIHQPTPVSPLMPSGLHRFGVPLIIGPMNGGMEYPPGYDDRQSPRQRALIRVGRWIAWLANRIVPGKRYAAVLLVANERTRRALPFTNHSDVRLLVENGVDLKIWAPRKEDTYVSAGPHRASSKLTLVYIGRLIDLKCVDITLRAVALARSKGIDLALDVIGDGPERNSLEKLAHDLGLAKVVNFRGFMSQRECAAALLEISGDGVLILNSVRECGGAVVLEAMALGLPVIASDWGGPADYLDTACGVLVSPIPRDTFSERLAEAIVSLAHDPQRRRRMGEAGVRKIAETFDWEKKVDSVSIIYREVLVNFNRSKTMQ